LAASDRSLPSEVANPGHTQSSSLRQLGINRSASLTRHSDVPSLTRHPDVPSLTRHIDVTSLNRHTDVTSLAHHTDVTSLARHSDVTSLARHIDVPSAARHHSSSVSSTSLARRRRHSLSDSVTCLLSRDKVSHRRPTTVTGKTPQVRPSGYPGSRAGFLWGGCATSGFTHRAGFFDGASLTHRTGFFDGASLSHRTSFFDGASLSGSGMSAGSFPLWVGDVRRELPSLGRGCPPRRIRSRRGVVVRCRICSPFTIQDRRAFGVKHTY